MLAAGTRRGVINSMTYHGDGDRTLKNSYQLLVAMIAHQFTCDFSTAVIAIRWHNTGVSDNAFLPPLNVTLPVHGSWYGTIEGWSASTGNWCHRDRLKVTATACRPETSTRNTIATATCDVTRRHLTLRYCKQQSVQWEFDNNDCLCVLKHTKRERLTF